MYIRPCAVRRSAFMHTTIRHSQTLTVQFGLGEKRAHVHRTYFSFPGGCSSTVHCIFCHQNPGQNPGQKSNQKPNQKPDPKNLCQTIDEKSSITLPDKQPTTRLMNSWSSWMWDQYLPENMKWKFFEIVKMGSMSFKKHDMEILHVWFNQSNSNIFISLFFPI